MGNEIKIGIGAKLESGFTSTVESVKKSVRETVAETNRIVAETAKAEASHYAMHRGIGAAFSVLSFAARRSLATILPTVASVIGGVSLIVGSVRILSGTLHLLERASGAATTGLGKFSLLEDLAGRLRGVTGSAAAAKQKLGELAGTFRGTGVAVPEAVEAYRTARVSDNGSGELSSSKGLTMLGDVAASSGNGIKDVTAAVGKLYDDLRAGAPIQDSADKLREMGVISDATRQQLDRLLASGQSGPQVWAALRGEFERAAGAMKESQNTLSSLQKSVQEAKSQLYESFGEGSANFEKDKLRTQATVLQKLQPAAQEAGDIYGAVKDSISGLIKKLLELVGVTAARDKALASGDGLKKLVDVYIVGRLALAAFAAAALIAIPILAAFNIIAGGLGVALVGVAAAAATIGGIVAVIAAVIGSVYIYTVHLQKLSDARLAYAQGTQAMANSLDRERAGLVSVAEKAKFLADAYARLKQAREDAANAKTPEDRALAQTRIGTIQTEIHSAETNAGVLQRQRSKLQGDLGNAKTSDERSDLNRRIATLTERINRGERATDDDYAPSEERAKIETELGQRQTPADNEAAAQAAEARDQAAARRAAELRRRAEEMAAQSSPENLVRLDNDIAMRRGRASTTHDAGEREKLTNEADQIETQKAGLPQQAEGAKTESARADLDAQKAADEAAAARKKVSDAKAAGAKQKAEDDKTAKDEADRKAKEASQQRVGLAEADAEAKLAAVGSEGIERAREEYEIRRQLLEIKLREALVDDDAVKLAGLKADYYRDQVAQAKKEEEATQQRKEAARELGSAHTDRVENFQKRSADAALADGKITPEQRRALDIDLLKKKQREAYAEARQMDEEAAREQTLGHDQRAQRLTIDAEKKREAGDNFGFDADALKNTREANRPVADSLARLGLGGNVAPSAKDPLLAIGERHAKAAEATVVLLKEIRDKRPTGREAPGRFGP